MSSPPDGFDLAADQLTEATTSVYRYVRRWSGDAELAEECAQEAVARAWAHREEFRSQKQLTAWMLTTARRIVIDHARTRARERRQSHDTETIVAAAAKPQEAMHHQERVARVMREMDALPARQRAIAYLHWVEQKSTADIAALLELSPSTVRSSLAIAREKLRSSVEHSQVKIERGTP